MKSAIILATLALAFGAPTVSSQDVAQQQHQTEDAMSGVQGSLTNARQVQDTLNRQLKQSGGDPHANADRIVAFITGADSQIDNAIATVSDALAPFTLGVSKMIGNVLLGPFVQSVTNGAEVLLSNLIGGGEDVINDALTAQITGNYSKLISLAKNNNVDTSKLENLNNQISNTMATKSKRDSDTVSIPEFLKSAVTNIKQTADTLVQQLKKGDGHAGEDTVDALITGLDSQVDNLANFIAKDLNGVTLGISGEIGDFLLGPIFQSLTNGAEVIISNVVGGSVDMVSDGAIKAFTKSLANLRSLGEKIDVSKTSLQSLDTAEKQLEHVKGDTKKTDAKKASTKGKRDTVSIPEFLKSAVTNIKQTADTLVQQLKKGDGHAGEDTVDALITGLDSQVDNLANFIAKDLNGVTLGISGEIGDFLLGPIFQSLTNGAEVIISNVVGGSVDMVSDGAIKAFTKSLANLRSLGEKIDVSKTKLQSLDTAEKQLEHVKGDTKKTDAKKASTKGKRDTVSIPEFLKSAFTNIKQTSDTLVQQLKKGDGHAGEDTVDALITGLDSQVDNLANFIAKDLNGVTLGISGEVGDFLLGPIFQSLTNGAEVIISNVVGGSVDMVSDGAVKAFTKSLADLRSLGEKIDVSKTKLQSLDTVQKQLAELKVPKSGKKEASKTQAKAATAAHKAKSTTTDVASKGKRASDADLSGATGSMTNYKQVLDTLNDQLKSHNGHAAQATINAFVTGADSQIDNAIATVSDALAPFTLGISKAIGNVLLGPFVQSVTNGAEVLISNLIGGAIDGVSDVSLEAYSKSLDNLAKLADKYGVSAEDKDTLVKAQQRVAAVLPKKN